MSRPTRRARPSTIARLGLTGAPSAAASVDPPRLAPDGDLTDDPGQAGTDTPETAQNAPDASLGSSPRAPSHTPADASVLAGAPAPPPASVPAPAGASATAGGRAGIRAPEPPPGGTHERTEASARGSAHTRTHEPASAPGPGLAPARTRARTRAKAREEVPAAVTEMRRLVDVEARRYAAAVRKLNTREEDLARAVAAALDAGATREQVRVWLADVMGEIPPRVLP